MSINYMVDQPGRGNDLPALHVKDLNFVHRANQQVNTPG